MVQAAAEAQGGAAKAAPGAGRGGEKQGRKRAEAPALPATPRRAKAAAGPASPGNLPPALKRLRAAAKTCEPQRLWDILKAASSGSSGIAAALQAACDAAR